MHRRPLLVVPQLPARDWPMLCSVVVVAIRQNWVNCNSLGPIEASPASDQPLQRFQSRHSQNRSLGLARCTPRDQRTLQCTWCCKRGRAVTTPAQVWLASSATRVWCVRRVSRHSCFASLSVLFWSCFVRKAGSSARERETKDEDEWTGAASRHQRGSTSDRPQVPERCLQFNNYNIRKVNLVLAKISSVPRP